MCSVKRLAVLLIYCATIGCSGGSGDGSRPPDVLDGERKPDPDLSTTLAIKDATGQFRSTFSPGEQIVFELTITNLRDEPVTVTRPNGFGFAFFVAPAGTRELVWDSNTGLSAPQVFQYDEFAAHETWISRQPWNQVRDVGLPLLPGEYVARGVYLAVGSGYPFQQSEFGSELIPFAIE